MSLEQYGLLFLFVTALVGTPGPANMSLMAYGARVGAIRALPFLLGTSFGFQLILVLNAMGLYGLLSLMPGVLWALKLACVGYIAYLAWGIARAPLAGARDSRETTPGADFLRGIWLHPLNPKAYAMQIAALTQFTSGEPSVGELGLVAITFFLWGGLLNFAWSAGGTMFARLAATPRRYRALMVTLAALMLASVIASLASLPA